MPVKLFLWLLFVCLLICALVVIELLVHNPLVLFCVFMASAVITYLSCTKVFKSLAKTPE